MRKQESCSGRIKGVHLHAQVVLFGLRQEPVLSLPKRQISTIEY